MEKLLKTLQILALSFSSNKPLKNDKKEELLTVLKNIEHVNNDKCVVDIDLSILIKILLKKSISKKDKEDIKLRIGYILLHINQLNDENEDLVTIDQNINTLNETHYYNSPINPFTDLHKDTMMMNICYTNQLELNMINKEKERSYEHLEELKLIQQHELIMKDKSIREKEIELDIQKVKLEVLKIKH
jgi:hypothetical protein